MPILPSLYSLIYRSQASRAVHEVTLGALLRKGRLHNEQADLTGLLLYAKGQFLHVLEGPEPALSDLFARISDDRRHYDVRTLSYGPVEARSFPEWRMGYATADVALFDQVTQFLELANTPGLTPPPSEEMNQLLRDYAQPRAQDDD